MFCLVPYAMANHVPRANLLKLLGLLEGICEILYFMEHIHTHCSMQLLLPHNEEGSVSYN